MSLCDNEVKRFVSRMKLLLNHHEELKLAINNKRNEASLENELVIQFALHIVVLWEAFINDLLLAYIEMYPKRALDSIEKRVRQSNEDKFGKSVGKCLSFSRPSNLSRAKLSAIIDHRGWNITPQRAEKLSAKANELIISRFAKKLSLNSEDSELFDYAANLRNFLSHSSRGARGILRESISNLSGRNNLPLKAKLGQIGPYLKGEAQPRKSRVVYIAHRLQNIAKKL